MLRVHSKNANNVLNDITISQFVAFNRGLLLFIFWTRAESDCLHIRLTISIVLRFVRSISTIHPPFKLVCRQSLSALVQKINNNNPLLGQNKFPTEREREETFYSLLFLSWLFWVIFNSRNAAINLSHNFWSNFPLLAAS